MCRPRDPMGAADPAPPRKPSLADTDIKDISWHTPLHVRTYWSGVSKFEINDINCSAKMQSYVVTR
jgi:hypothetical protein